MEKYNLGELKMKKNKEKNDMLKIRRIMDDRYYHLCEEIKWDEENTV